MKTFEKARFDTRIPVEQKDFFEYAASLGGFRTLTEFVIYSTQLQADKIVEKHHSILASKKDQQIFFDAIMTAQEPNDQLKKAAKQYNKSVVDK